MTEKFIIKELRFDKYLGRAPNMNNEESYTTYSSIQNACFFVSYEDAKSLIDSFGKSSIHIYTIITIYQ